MKLRGLFVLLLLAMIQNVAEAQETLAKANSWSFNYANDWYAQNDSILCQRIDRWTFICFDPGYDFEVNGRSYELCFSEPPVFPTASARRTAETDRFYALAVRRENGRVYANYQDYLDYLSLEVGSVQGPRANPDYIPYPLTDDGEIILYDYNMEVGDKYRSVEGYDDVSVASKDSIVLDDGMQHRRLTLSNGLILIEGIGCINSNGMLLDYLNPASIFANNFTYLDYAYSMENRVYKNTIFKVGDLYVNNMAEPHTQSVNKCHLFDLQGRRILSEPQHGLYIKNGKKVMK